LPLTSSHKEQPSVIRLLWAKGLSAIAIQSENHPVYGGMYFTRPTIRVWGKMFAHGRESVVDEEETGSLVTMLFPVAVAALLLTSVLHRC